MSFLYIVLLGNLEDQMLGKYGPFQINAQDGIIHNLCSRLKFRKQQKTIIICLNLCVKGKPLIFNAK